MFKKVNKKENTNNLNEEIARKVYVDSLQELVKAMQEKDDEIEYYKNKNKTQTITIKRLRNRIRELESKKRKWGNSGI